MKSFFSLLSTATILLLVCANCLVETADFLKCYSCVYGEKSSASEFNGDELHTLIFDESCASGKRPKTKFVKNCDKSVESCIKIHGDFNSNRITIRDCMANDLLVKNECKKLSLKEIRASNDSAEFATKFSLFDKASENLQAEVCVCGGRDACNGGSVEGISKLGLVIGIFISGTIATFLRVI